MLIKVGLGVCVGVVGFRKVVGAIVGSGRWAGVGGHVSQGGEALQAEGGVPAGVFTHGTRFGETGVDCRVAMGGGDVLGRRLVVAVLRCGGCVGGGCEGGIDLLVCGDVVLGWLRREF